MTPNTITVLSFLCYVVACVLLVWVVPFHLMTAGVLFFIGFVLDDLDGQVARTRKLSSPIGDYLDKTLDVLKIFTLTISLGIAVYFDTKNAIYIVLAFIACFFFMYRYYIKLETMFGQISLDPKYLEKSQNKREHLTQKYDQMHANLQSTWTGKLTSFWHTHKLIFFVDEAEFAIFTAIGAVLNQLKIVIWILALSQIVIGIYRFFQRAHMLKTKPESFINPLRK